MALAGDTVSVYVKLNMIKEYLKDNKDRLIKGGIISFIGILGMGFFLSFLILVGYGTDPYTFMNRSLAARFGMTLGNLQLIVNIVLVMLTVIFNRKLIGLGTIFNMVLVGYYADFFCWSWNKLFPGYFFTDMPYRVIIFVVTILGFVISAAAYMNADAGLSPYDALPKIISDAIIARHPKAPFFILRICYDFLAILAGILAGGRPTIGIVLIAILLGPAITLVGRIMKKNK